MAVLDKMAGLDKVAGLDENKIQTQLLTLFPTSVLTLFFTIIPILFLILTLTLFRNFLLNPTVPCDPNPTFHRSLTLFPTLS